MSPLNPRHHYSVMRFMTKLKYHPTHVGDIPTGRPKDH